MTEDERLAMLIRYRALAESAGTLCDALITEFGVWTNLVTQSTDCELVARIVERLEALQDRLNALAAVRQAEFSQMDHLPEKLH